MATDGPVDHACTCPSLRATVTSTLALLRAPIRLIEYVADLKVLK